MAGKGIIGAITTLAGLLAAAPVFADATLVVQGSDGLESTIQVRHGRGRMSTAGMPEYLVFDAGTGSITYVEPNQRRYMQATAAELQSGMQAVAGIREHVAPYMTDLLAGLPAEQRRHIEQRMGAVLGAPAAGHTPAAPRLERVDRGTHTFAGLACNASGILQDGRPVAEVCMATGPSGKLSGEDYSTLAGMVSVLRSLGQAAGTHGMPLGLADQLAFLDLDIDGVPVAVRDLESGRRYQVSAVSNAPLSNALFEDYAAYQRQDMMALLRQQPPAQPSRR